MSDIAHALIRPTECTEGVTRHDTFEPCGARAVAVRIDPDFGEPYPVCKRHVRGDMVPLADVIAAAHAQALRDAARTIGDDAASSDYLADHVSDDGLAWFMRRLRDRADGIARGESS